MPKCTAAELRRGLDTHLGTPCPAPELPPHILASSGARGGSWGDLRHHGALLRGACLSVGPDSCSSHRSGQSCSRVHAVVRASREPGRVKFLPDSGREVGTGKRAVLPHS